MILHARALVQLFVLAEALYYGAIYQALDQWRLLTPGIWRGPLRLLATPHPLRRFLFLYLRDQVHIATFFRQNDKKLCKYCS